MQKLVGAILLDNCDITATATQERLRQVLDGQLADVILSDMAPPSTGVRSLDHEQIVRLVMSVLRLSLQVLKVCTEFS